MEQRSGATAEDTTENPRDEAKDDVEREEIDSAPAIDGSLSNERLDTWTLLKRQVASDFAPLLVLIPAPIKQLLVAWLQHTKCLSFNLFYGSMKSTLVIASKALGYASTVLSSLVDELERRRSAYPISSQPKSNRGVLLSRIQQKLKRKRLLSRKKPREIAEEVTAEERVVQEPVVTATPEESEEIVIEI